MKNQNVTLKNATILVTGAAGFIGSNLVLELLRTTEPVHIIGIDDIKTNWFLRNLPQSTIITYLIHSTCWLTIFRQSFIMWQINHYGILFTLCMFRILDWKKIFEATSRAGYHYPKIYLSFAHSSYYIRKYK